MSEKNYIICLDDDPLIFRIIERCTAMQVLPFSSLEGLRNQAKKYKPEAVMLDIHLDNKECGIDIIPELKNLWPFTPIIVITADTKLNWVAQALAAGAQDFIKKPLQPEEVKARVSLRIAEGNLLLQKNIFTFGNTTYFAREHQLEGNEKKCFISEIEAKLLELFLKHREQNCERIQLMREVWGSAHVSSSAIEQRISSLRKNLLFLDSNFEIKTIQGKGYKFCPKDIKENSYD